MQFGACSLVVGIALFVTPRRKDVGGTGFEAIRSANRPDTIMMSLVS
jgi:hypothetical protein